jgi:hypothetical protein
LNLSGKIGEPLKAARLSRFLAFQEPIISVKAHTLFGQNPHPFRSKPTCGTIAEIGLVEPF